MREFFLDLLSRYKFLPCLFNGSVAQEPFQQITVCSSAVPSWSSPPTSNAVANVARLGGPLLLTKSLEKHEKRKSDPDVLIAFAPANAYRRLEKMPGVVLNRLSAKKHPTVGHAM
jgi:hypothetical protein